MADPQTTHRLLAQHVRLVERRDDGTVLVQFDDGTISRKPIRASELVSVAAVRRDQTIEHGDFDIVDDLRSMMAEGYGGPELQEAVEKGCAEIERLRAIENAAIAWRDARDRAVFFRKCNHDVDPVRVMIPVGRALDALADLLATSKVCSDG